MVLDEIIVANWPNNEHILCNVNNYIPFRITSHPYVLINRSVLCNCGIEADNHYLLESLAAYNNTNSKLTIYLTINTAFANYLDMFPNLTESLELPIIKNRTTFKQILPVSLNISNFDKTLLPASTDLKEFISRYTKNNFFLICKKGMIVIVQNQILTKISFLTITYSRHFHVYFSSNPTTSHNFNNVFIM